MRELWEYRLFPSWRFVAVSSVWAISVTLIIAATKSPFWTFYLAPLSAAPLMIHEIRALDARYEQQKAHKEPPVEQVDQGRRAA